MVADQSSFSKAGGYFFGTGGADVAKKHGKAFHLSTGFFVVQQMNFEWVATRR